MTIGDWHKKDEAEQIKTRNMCPDNWSLKISPAMTMKEVELLHIKNTVNFLNGNKDQAAKALGISRQSIYRKLKFGRYGDKWTEQNKTS